MNDADKLKIYTAMTETTRKWVSVMDTKAGFLSTMNAGLLGFIWTGGKIIEGGCWQKYLGITATAFSLFSLLCALWVVLPRTSLKQVFGRNTLYVDGFKPISFYGFIANNYPKAKIGGFLNDVKKLDESALIDESLEQHFTLSHVVQTKSNYVAIAGWLLIAALSFTGTALFLKALL